MILRALKGPREHKGNQEARRGWSGRLPRERVRGILVFLLPVFICSDPNHQNDAKT
jgi:hypothetical protein